MLLRMLKWFIRKSIELYDRIEPFRTYSWGIDEITDYNIIVERSYPDRHEYGTQIIYYSSDGRKKDG